VVRRIAGFHRYDAWVQPAEKLQHGTAPNLAGEDRTATIINSMDLEDVLRQIEANPRDSGELLGRLRHGRLPSDGSVTTPILALLMPSGRRPPHHSNPAVRSDPAAVERGGDFLALDDWKRQQRNRIVDHGGRGGRESARRVAVSNKFRRDSISLSYGRQPRKSLAVNKTG
jgi:hypothetical protein